MIIVFLFYSTLFHFILFSFMLFSLNDEKIFFFFFFYNNSISDALCQLESKMLSKSISVPRAVCECLRLGCLGTALRLISLCGSGYSGIS